MIFATAFAAHGLVGFAKNILRHDADTDAYNRAILEAMAEAVRRTEAK